MQLTDLEWNTEFTSTILLHDSIVPNQYTVTIKFNSTTDNINNQKTISGSKKICIIIY